MAVYRGKVVTLSVSESPLTECRLVITLTAGAVLCNRVLDGEIIMQVDVSAFRPVVYDFTVTEDSKVCDTGKLVVR